MQDPAGEAQLGPPMVVGMGDATKVAVDGDLGVCGARLAGDARVPGPANVAAPVLVSPDRQAEPGDPASALPLTRGDQPLVVGRPALPVHPRKFGMTHVVRFMNG